MRVNLPPELAERYEVVGEVASGGESDVLLVRRRVGQGEDISALKIYRHGLEPDSEALETIRGLPRAHVVEIHDCGRSTAGWWEEQEYLEQGSLADLLVAEGPKLQPERLREVVVELSEALAAVHPVLHRDVKPTNVFVRAAEPLDLVLGDFGLARSTAHTHIVSTVAGSLAYQSPEALDGGASVARDWWAVGMIIAEAAIGRHPYYDIELGWAPVAEIRIALTTRAVPLDGIDDERILLLCRGLLVRDPRDRWGADEVRAWLAGGSPAVTDAPVGRPHSVGIQQFVFAGERVSTPDALAPLLAQRWHEALRLISGAASEAPDYVRLILWLQDHHHEAALRVLEQGTQERSFARRLFRLLHALDPDLPPSFRGRVVDRDGLLGVASAAACGDDEAQTIVYDIYELGIIGEVARDERSADLVGIEESWRDNMELLPQLRDELGSLGEPFDDDAVIRTVRARVLLALLDATERDELIAAVGDARQPALRGDSASREVFERARGDGTQPVRLAAALLAVEPARERYEREVAERRAAEDAELARRKAEEQAAREMRLRRVRRRDFSIIFVTAAALATVWPAAGLGDLLSRVGPLRDGGSIFLRRLDAAPPIVNSAHWATGGVIVLSLAALALCARREVRAHPLAVSAIGLFAMGAAVLAALLPGIRDSEWRRELSLIATPQLRGSCTLSESAAYMLGSGIRQPVLVGAAPACQTVARLSRRRGLGIWTKWVRRIRISRIHKFDKALLVGGTYGGRRTSDGHVVGGRLVVVGLAPRSGRELWRRTCRAPGDGEHAIAFRDARAGRQPRAYVRLRCATGEISRFQPRTGKRF